MTDKTLDDFIDTSALEQKLAEQTISPEEQARIDQAENLEDKIIAILHTVKDPEIPVNIYELGLIYDLDITEKKEVLIKMTLTTPACPVAGAIPVAVKEKIERHAPECTSVDVTLVWEPKWTMDRMTDEAKLELGLL